ncbi:MAG: dihydroxyacetone kinase subunit DhaK, partial [Pediococcus pentosaceus]|nr:dihydroxyacetone kinase subunit DhaK [Pediococcus pentosaceus]
LVNGMGATPLMEQYIFMNDVLNKLADLGLEVKFTKVGSLMTSLEMAGISLTLFKVSDEIVENLNYATDTIAW